MDTEITVHQNNQVDDVLIKELEVIQSQEYGVQLDWLRDLGEILSSDETVQDLIMFRKCRVLYTARHAWENLEDEVKGHWNYDFYCWARAYTKSRARQPAKSTIRNMIATYNVFVASGEVELPKTVELPKRTETGRVIRDGKIMGFLVVDFSIAHVDYSKLLVSKSYALKCGSLPDEIWTAIADPYVGVKELIIRIKRLERLESEQGSSSELLDGNENGQVKSKFYEQEGIIFAAKNGRRIPLFGLMLEEANDPFFYEAVVDLFELIQLEVPEYLMKGLPM
jgi:hypothetical protein